MDIIGHENTKKQLGTAISAARERNTAAPHMLFAGAPGCGKTTLANYLAQTMGSPFLSVVPNDLKDRKSVVKALDKLDHRNYDANGNRVGKVKPTILFLDEVHNLPLKGQELLGLVMERFRLEASKPNTYHWVPYFTLVGATTVPGNLSKPFRDRFKLNFLFSPYKDEEMHKIIQYHANRIGIRLSMAGIYETVVRSRGTPRIAVGFLERIRDYMLSVNSRVATGNLVREVFEDLKIDSQGFNELEIKLMWALHDAGAPVSLDNLSIIIQEDPKSIRGFAEPYLIRKGMILVSGKGRVLTDRGREYLNSSGKSDKLVKMEIDFDYERK
jgi:Holliday junction DNA helicase RuvB